MYSDIITNLYSMSSSNAVTTINGLTVKVTCNIVIYTYVRKRFVIAIHCFCK